MSSLTTETADAGDATAETGALDLRRVVGLALGLTALLTLLLTAFTWPPSELEPRSLPLAIAGPADAVATIESEMAAALGEDAVDRVEVESRAAAIEAIEDRDAYGAIIAGPDGVEVLTASAASAQVAQLLTQAAQTMAAQGDQASQGGAAPTVTDVVPTPSGDPRGVIFNAGALPLALGGIMVGAATSLALRRTRDRVAAALLVAVGAGLVLAGVLQGWLDAIGGNYAANAAVIALGVLAVALPIIGLRHLLGLAGVGIMALLVLLVGNPLSGVTSAPELLPLGWLGQLLPPGAVGSALRGTAYFDGAGTGSALLVLAAWVVAGLALTLAPRKE